MTRSRRDLTVFSLVIGGAGSGKSAYAEALSRGLSETRIYVATMEAQSAAAQERIARHRAQRAGYGFQTVERTCGLAGLELPPQANVLLEDLGNLMANELYDPRGGGFEAALEGVLDLRERVRHLTVVSVEVGAGGTAYAGDTLRYLRALGKANRLIAYEADYVCEVVAGQPNVLKGVDPCA